MSTTCPSTKSRSQRPSPVTATWVHVPAPTGAAADSAAAPWSAPSPERRSAKSGAPPAVRPSSKPIPSPLAVIRVAPWPAVSEPTHASSAKALAPDRSAPPAAQPWWPRSKRRPPSATTPKPGAAAGAPFWPSPSCVMSSVSRARMSTWSFQSASSWTRPCCIKTPLKRAPLRCGSREKSPLIPGPPALSNACCAGVNVTLHAELPCGNV